MLFRPLRFHVLNHVSLFAAFEDTKRFSSEFDITKTVYDWIGRTVQKIDPQKQVVCC